MKLHAPPSPHLGYLDDASLVETFERFVVFNRECPRQQIGILALDAEHAEVEGANYLELPRHRVHVFPTPGFLESSQQA